MATGISKKNWNGNNLIIESGFEPKSSFFTLDYLGKKSVQDILEIPLAQDYVPTSGTGDNFLFYGENFDVLKFLHNTLKDRIKLIYIDPPYGTNSIFQTSGQKDSYQDVLIGANYLEFLRERLVLLREILAPDGSIYVHLDHNMICEVKLIMDEIFGGSNFRSLITRKKCSNKNATKKTFGNISDYILFYTKTDDYIWNRPTTNWTDDKIKKEYPCVDELSGRLYKKVPIHAPGIRNGETNQEWRGLKPPQGKHWQYTPKKLEEFHSKGEIYWSSNRNPRRKVFLDESKGIPVQNIWSDLQDSINQNTKVTDYPTEKNPNLLKRIIEASSNIGDTVLDCFVGSGTTIDVSRNCGRNWIGIDNSELAIRSSLERLEKNGLTESEYKLFVDSRYKGCVL